MCYNKACVVVIASGHFIVSTYKHFIFLKIVSLCTGISPELDAGHDYSLPDIGGKNINMLKLHHYSHTIRYTITAI